MKSWILYLIIGLITYGSLYPFSFSIPAAHGAAWTSLFSDLSLGSSRMDAFGNLLLFVPFGFAGILSIANQASLTARIMLVTLSGCALALLLQIGQIYVPQRSPALSDVLWNLIGIGGGIAAGLSMRLTPQRLQSGNALPVGVLALWIAAELLPFVPTLDVQSIRHNVKNMLRPTLDFNQLLFHAAGALMAGRALAAIIGEIPARRWLLLLAGAVAAGKVLVVTLTLTVSILLGLALGCAAAWWLGAWREPRRASAVLLVLFAAYACGALMPFEFRDFPESFSLIPFAGLLRGSMLVNTQALAANLSLFAGMLWLIKTLGGRIAPGSIALAGFVLMFELVQIYAVGRTPDITEPLLVLLLGQLFNAVSQTAPVRARSPAAERAPRHARAAPPKTAAAGIAAAPREADKKTRKNDEKKAFSYASWGACLGAICLAMAFVFYRILRLPQLPYNVVELFLGSGAFPFLMIFALALLWIGAGARLAGHFIAASAKPWLALPLCAFGAGLICLLLLSASVTEESLADIAGSNNLHWFVVNKDIWGAGARELFMRLPVGVVEFFERPVRFAALYGPLVTFLALMFIAVNVIHRHRRAPRHWGLLILSALLWLWLCKGIAFDWSSTDNLNELIARDGPAGWGGGGYLYLLVALICANAVLLSQMRFTVIGIALAAGATCAAVPVGWWLLNNGLEQYVEKYSLVFSGVQFLLGPDRKQTLTQEMLFLRWSIVQFSGVLVIAAGARIAQPVIDRLSERHARPHKNAAIAA